MSDLAEGSIKYVNRNGKEPGDSGNTEIEKERKRILVEMWHKMNDRIISW